MRRCVLLTALISSACYTYVPARVESVSPGTDVRVYLTDEAVSNLKEPLELNGRQVEGQLIAHNGTEMYFELPRRLRGEGRLERILRQRVTIPARDIVAVEVRSLDRFRTGALVVGAAVGGMVFVTGLFSGEGRTGRGKPPGGETDTWVPSFGTRSW
ncbi:MAG: hypothetical protein HY704_15330 [Gemmatimonadetes bacterium]|nr:hypothetical protein [Gemmatimonadota bacterium]